MYSFVNWIAVEGKPYPGDSARQLSLCIILTKALLIVNSVGNSAVYRIDLVFNVKYTRIKSFDDYFLG